MPGSQDAVRYFLTPEGYMNYSGGGIRKDCVALQYHDPTDMQGHDRVIVGYNLSQEVFILNDPSNFGPGYRMGFDEFDSLWSYNGYGSPGLFYLVMPKTSESPLPDRSPYSWY